MLVGQVWEAYYGRKAALLPFLERNLMRHVRWPAYDHEIFAIFHAFKNWSIIYYLRSLYYILIISHWYIFGLSEIFKIKCMFARLLTLASSIM